MSLSRLRNVSRNSWVAWPKRRCLEIQPFRNSNILQRINFQRPYPPKKTSPQETLTERQIGRRFVTFSKISQYFPRVYLWNTPRILSIQRTIPTSWKSLRFPGSRRTTQRMTNFRLSRRLLYHINWWQFMQDLGTSNVLQQNFWTNGVCCRDSFTFFWRTRRIYHLLTQRKIRKWVWWSSMRWDTMSQIMVPPT